MNSRFHGSLGLLLAAFLCVCSGTVIAAAPVAYDQTADIDQGTSITLCGTDADGDPLTYAIETQPANGTLFGTPPTVDYTPGFSFAGSDSFTFSVNDGTADSNIATVTITQGGGDVTSGACSGGGGTNTAPVANGQSVTVNEDSSVGITLEGSDADGDPLSYSVVTPPSNGGLTGTPPNLTYSPDSNYNGGDSFTFIVNDGTENSAEATVSITVNAVNDTPVADAQSVSLDQDSSVTITLTGSDPDGDALTYSIATNPSNGALSTSGAEVSYTPSAGFSGSDSFTFTVNDGTVDSAAATVSITVNPVNTAPVADSQSVSILADVPRAITLSGSDADGDTLTYNVESNPASGSLSGTAPDVTYTADSGFTGSDSFTFTVNDGTEDSAAATVDLEVVSTYPLNDTGAITCGSTALSNLDCDAVNATADTAGTDSGGNTVPAGQDAHFGRDATDNDDSDGHAGFSFTKLDSNGDPLPASATSWDCVQDNVTGRIWEVKTNDNGLHGKNHRYSWFDSRRDPYDGIGSPGDAGTCSFDSANCNTENFVSLVNNDGLCGASDWRMPHREELLSIVVRDGSRPAIDTNYFPNTGSHYWTASTAAGNAFMAWTILFGESTGSAGLGGVYSVSKTNFDLRVRLVRDGK